MRLFADSSGWIALFGENDKYHAAARQAFENAVGQRLSLVTTDYIFDETVTFLRMRYGVETAVQCGNYLLTSPLITLVEVSAEMRQQAWDMFGAYTDKTWAFTDCTSFVAMQHEKIWHAFTFDEHFAQAGFQTWPEG